MTSMAVPTCLDDETRLLHVADYLLRQKSPLQQQSRCCTVYSSQHRDAEW